MRDLYIITLLERGKGGLYIQRPFFLIFTIKFMLNSGLSNNCMARFINLSNLHVLTKMFVIGLNFEGAMQKLLVSGLCLLVS